MGQKAWKGIVHAFDLAGAPDGGPYLCLVFANRSDKRRCFAVLHMQPIPSPRHAVRKSKVAERQEIGR